MRIITLNILSFIILNIFYQCINNKQIIIPFKILNKQNEDGNYIELLLKNQLYAEINLGTPEQTIYLSITTETESFSIESKLINDKFYSHNESSTYINTEKKLSFYHERYKSGKIFKDNFYFQSNLNEKTRIALNNISFDYIYELSEEYINKDDAHLINNNNKISGEIGLQIQKIISSNSNILNSLNNIKAIDKNIWSLLYKKEKGNEGYLIIGENLKQFKGEGKRTNAYINGIYYYWYFFFSDIYSGNIKFNKERIGEYAPQLGVIIGSDEYKIYVNNTFFRNLIEKNACKTKNITNKRKIYSFFECEKVININNFKPLIFSHQELSYNFILDKNDLFIDYKNKKYFLCIFLEEDLDINYYENHNWILGSPFTKKYFFSFDADSKVIFFCEDKNWENANNRSSGFFWFIVSTFGILTVILSIYLIIKIIYRPKRIIANELEDSFSYLGLKNISNETDIGDFNNSKYNKLGIYMN